MKKRVFSEELTRQELEALYKSLQVILAGEEFRDRAAALGRTAEEIFETERHQTPEQQEAWARDWLAMIAAGVQVEKLSDPELFFLRIYPVERVHEDRFINGKYRVPLLDIERQMNRVRVNHGLSDDEYWPIGEGPEEWEALAEEHSVISDRLYVGTLEEFGLRSEASLFSSEPIEFARRREMGRQAVHEGLSNTTV